MALNLRMWTGIVGRAVISLSMETKEIRFALDITGGSTACIYLSAYKLIHGPCDFREQILQLSRCMASNLIGSRKTIALSDSAYAM